MNDYRDYVVRWELLVTAQDSKEAATLAREAQLDLDSLAQCFEVAEVTADGRPLVFNTVEVEEP
jgi:hypothetical protein